MAIQSPDQQERRAQGDYLEAIFRSTVTGIAEIGVDGSIRTVNDRFCEMVGRSREELLGLDCYDITHPDDRAQTRASLQSLLDGTPHFTIEKRYVRPDGA